MKKYYFFFNKNIDFSVKAKSDFIWSALSFIIAGICGFSLTFLIAKYYNAEVLGLINTTLIIYTIYGQITTFGIHFASLNFFTVYREDKKEISTILKSSFLNVIIISIILSTLFYIMSDFTGKLFKVDGLAKTLKIISPAFIFFSMNKVLFSYYNALRKIRHFSIFYALRLVCWILFFIYFAVNNYGGSELSFLFLYSEFIVFVLMMISVYKILFIKISSKQKWGKQIAKYGYKSVFGTIFADINNRVDVLVLGIFSTGSIVGIYSMGTIFLDALLMLAVVLRININPVLTETYTKESKEILREKILRVKKLFYIFSFIIGIIIITIYPLIIKIANLPKEYLTAYIPLIIIMIGYIFASGYLPFQMIFNQTGFPVQQSLYFGIILIVNLFFNFLLIPFWGVYGASIATCVSLMVIPFFINYLSRRSIGISY